MDSFNRNITLADPIKGEFLYIIAFGMPLRERCGNDIVPLRGSIRAAIVYAPLVRGAEVGEARIRDIRNNAKAEGVFEMLTKAESRQL